MFIKFFDGCIISKRMRKVKNRFQFITFLSALVFTGMFLNIIVNIDYKDISSSIAAFVSIMYVTLIIMVLYFKETVVILLFPNEYFLMKSIKCYLGKIFRDFYLSDVVDDKVVKHISTLSYYIASLYDIQRIKSENNCVFSNKLSTLACNEFLYLINNKLLRDGNYTYTISDLYSKRISDVMFGIFTAESDIINKETEYESEIDIELNAFLNSKFGQKFINENIIYNSVTFDDYYCDEWRLYNKRNLPVIDHTPYYRRHIDNNNKESYNKKDDKIRESKKNKYEKSYLSWIDNI